ncbi:hypothetical protein ONS96_014919 [Cadophora gregata f. sp. sojae]|nr:hypothetical protein ONS96_014919 [Cadophora gregata f. sp. sojae]
MARAGTLIRTYEAKSHSIGLVSRVQSAQSLPVLHLNIIRRRCAILDSKGSFRKPKNIDTIRWTRQDQSSCFVKDGYVKSFISFVAGCELVTQSAENLSQLIIVMQRTFRSTVTLRWIYKRRCQISKMRRMVKPIYMIMQRHGEKLWRPPANPHATSG